MKRIVTLIMLLVFGLVLAGCKKDEPIEIDNKYYKEADQLLHNVYEDFWNPGANRFTAYSPEDLTPGSEYRGTSALWDYGAVMTALGLGIKANPTDPFLLEKIDEIVVELEQYRYPTTRYVYYGATVGGGEPYYDDNAWVVLGLYEYAKALGNDEYMELSADILEYVLSGESEDGGIYWKESVVSRNTCSTAPAILGALLHYQETGDEELLNTAIRLYDWTVDVLRDPSDYLYWDNAIKQEDGTELVERTKWTYNTGTMIWAGVLLHEITGEERFLNDANLSIESSLNTFYTFNEARNSSYFTPTPWFNLYLFRGYVEHAKHTGEEKYVDALIHAADSAIEFGKDERGYIYPSWGSGRVLSEYEYVKLLETAATIETFYMIAEYQLTKIESEIEN